MSEEGDQGLSRHTSRITVKDCSIVLLQSQNLVQMDGLISVNLENVANLTLVSNSFKLSPKATSVKLSLRNVSLATLPSNTFHGDIESITLESSRINRLSAFAFANLVNTNIVSLKDCVIQDLEAQAFKKFEVKFLHLIGGSLGKEVPSRAINDLEVHEKFMLDGVKMGVVRSSAFVVKKPKTVAIQHCTLESLESEAFNIGATRGTVIIKNNTFGNLAFGAFLSITTDESAAINNQQQQHTLLFKNNNLTNFEEGSLAFDRSSFRIEVNNLLINQPCDCNLLSLWRNRILNYTNVRARLIANNDINNIVALPLESDSETFFCLDDYDDDESSKKSISSFVDYETHNCVLAGNFTIIVTAMISLLVVLVLAGCLVVYCCRIRRRCRDSSSRSNKRNWISVPTSAPDVVSKKNGVATTTINNHDGSNIISGNNGPVDSRITMVVPDGRLYRETEFHVIVEKAEPLTTEL